MSEAAVPIPTTDCIRRFLDFKENTKHLTSCTRCGKPAKAYFKLHGKWCAACASCAETRRRLWHEALDARTRTPHPAPERRITRNRAAHDRLKAAEAALAQMGTVHKR
jgi:ribosomal protein L37E